MILLAKVSVSDSFIADLGQQTSIVCIFENVLLRADGESTTPVASQGILPIEVEDICFVC